MMKEWRIVLEGPKFSDETICHWDSKSQHLGHKLPHITTRARLSLPFSLQIKDEKEAVL